MKKLKLTPSSSSAYEPEIESLSPAAIQFLYAQNEELQHHRTTNHDRPYKARQERTDRIDQTVKEAIELHRLDLIEIPARKRTAFLQGKIAAILARAMVDGEFPLDYTGTKTVPDEETTRSILRKQGL